MSMKLASPDNIIRLRDALLEDIKITSRIEAGFGDDPADCNTALGTAAANLVRAKRAQMLGNAFAAHGYAQDAVRAGSDTPADEIITAAASSYRVPQLIVPK